MNIEESHSFGHLVRARRLFLDMTQGELAQRAMCATISIRRIEAETLRPSTQLAEQLADVLQIPSEERDAFIKLARSVSYDEVHTTENFSSSDLPVDRGIDTRMWQHTERLLVWLPLLFGVIAVAVNPRYMGSLLVVEPPFLINQVVPIGWLVILLVFALMSAAKILLQNGRRGAANQQIYYRTGLNGFVMLFLTFPTILLLLLAPALFQLIRSGAY